MPKAKDQFDESIKDAEELLAHFDKLIGGKVSAPPKEAEVLKRAGLILALTAWETYIEDRIREAVEAQLSGIMGSPIANFVTTKYEEEMKRFHTPNTERCRKLSLAYAGKDVTAKWKVWGGDAADAQKRLDDLVKLRGKAAHRSPTPTGRRGVAPHLISRTDLESAITFLKSLVQQTEQAMK